MKVMMISDVHIPYIDMTSVKKALKAITKEKPDHLVLGGDIIDNFKISSHTKSPLEGVPFSQELKELKKFLITVRKLCGKKCTISYLKGNHEERLERYIHSEAPGLAGWGELEYTKLFGLDELDIEFYEEEDHLFIDEVLYKHGHELQGFSGVPGGNARKAMERYGCSVVSGHCHKGNIIRKTTLTKQLFAVENPCLCDTNPKYVKGFAQWQQGYTIIEDGEQIRQVMTK